MLLGGRFSRHVAAMLAGYLLQFRSGVRDIGALSPQDFDRAGRSRQDATCWSCSTIAAISPTSSPSPARPHARGVHILLFTDPWLSPIAEFRRGQTMVAPIEANSPYDTLATAVAQMEAVLAHALDAHGERRPRAHRGYRERSAAPMP